MSKLSFASKLSKNLFANKTTGLACAVWKEVKVVVPGLVGWAAPAAVFAGWMIWPALTSNFKRTIGLSWAAEELKSDVEYVENDSEDGAPTLK